LDHLLFEGLSRSSIPFAAGITRFFDAARAAFSSLDLLILRLWLAASLLPLGDGTFSVLGQAGISSSRWIPAVAGAALFARVGPFFALPIGFGIANRLAAALALCTMGYGMMAANDGGFGTFWTLEIAAGSGARGRVAPLCRSDMAKGPFSRSAGKAALRTGAATARSDRRPRASEASPAPEMRHALVQVALIDRHNYHLFQPLLYQVATAALSPGDIATPVRSMLRDHFNVRVLLGEVTGIDTARQLISAEGFAEQYDYIVVAAGATHSYFGRTGWERYAPGLKRIEDATYIRSRVLSAFERAEVATNECERQGLLTFVIVGAGPTGVELAGAIAELARAIGVRPGYASDHPTWVALPPAIFSQVPVGT
jgi:NADH:ubiquinone reductase (H+-translocating)